MLESFWEKRNQLQNLVHLKYGVNLEVTQGLQEIPKEGAHCENSFSRHQMSTINTLYCRYFAAPRWFHQFNFKGNKLDRLWNMHTFQADTVQLLWPNMLLFCPTCGNLLLVEESANCLRFSCGTCPYISNISRVVKSRNYPKLKVNYLYALKWTIEN